MDSTAPITFSATYSVEDNKLRLYPSARLPSALYERVKAAGFKFAKYQALFVAPRWTPAREDLCTELAGQIEAEDMTLAERAQIKAERLDGYAARRSADGDAYAEAARQYSQGFAGGQPILMGHHSQRKAERDHERAKQALKRQHDADDKAAYWLYRAEGVEAHANRHNDPRVRARRIETLLKELRDHQRALTSAERNLALWEGADTDEKIHALANNYNTSSRGDYDALRKQEKTPAEVRAANVERFARLVTGPNRRRCIAHVLGRLSYEQSQLGPTQRHTGDLTPVILQAFARKHGAEKPKATQTETGFLLQSPATLPAHIAKGQAVERTADEWRDAMQACGYTVPEAKPRRASKSTRANSPLINPTEAEAERLQALWNRRNADECEARGVSASQIKTESVTPASQAAYSQNAKGSYAKCKTVEIDADGRRVRTRYHRGESSKSAEPVFRVRIFTGRAGFYKADSVMHITDKGTKPLPLDWTALESTGAEAREACRA